ncbi:MAG: glycosyltransferase family 4 protein [Chloroflexi bacterium]|nr:glycosyltransferase family 4 protein [Chloroflexota bacterium]
MQLKIGIDFTSAARERAGIGRYARELVRALARRDRLNEYLLFVPRDAHDDLLRFGWPANFSIKHAPLTERVLAALWHRARVPLPVEAFVGAVDVFYSPDFLLPPTWARKTIVTVHDLSYVRMPECFPDVLKRYLNRSVPRAVRRADLVLADAASTQRDLEDIYRLPSEKIKVLYSGVDARFCPEIPEAEKTRVREKYKLVAPYLLSVGTLQPRKNYARLIQAFSRLSNFELPTSNFQLVIVGSKGWMFDEVFQTVERLGLQDRVLFPDFVSDDDLPALFAMATLFVYPSLYEGFGLPVAEAMACGVPVVCSNASSLPEVAGDAALYFDPRDVEAMADAMRRALGSESLRDDLRAKGLARVKRFTWEKAAGELLECLTC